LEKHAATGARRRDSEGNARSRSPKLFLSDWKMSQARLRNLNILIKLDLLPLAIEGHHPDISFGWGYATVSLSTKKIKGLHENDFIMASKIDRMFPS
jgi:hypothetical protein